MATNLTRVNSDSKDSDVHITYADQERINKFARCNARFLETKDEIKSKENDMQNLQDADDEMMMALDADEKIPFMIGEVFIMKTQDEARENISSQSKILREEVGNLNIKAQELQDVMNQLKADLYAKFGNNINLEPDEE